MMKVKFNRLTYNARLSTKATPGSTCFDVYWAENISLEPGVTKSIKHDLG